MKREGSRLERLRRQPIDAALQPRGEPGTVPPGEAPDPTNCMNSSWTDILPRRDLLRELTPSEA